MVATNQYLYYYNSGTGANYPTGMLVVNPWHVPESDVRLEVRDRNWAGTASVQRFADKGKWLVEWRGITRAQRDVLRTVYLNVGTIYFKPKDDSVLYSCLAYGWTDNREEKVGGVYRYACSMTLEVV